MTLTHIDCRSIDMTQLKTVRRHSGMGIIADRHSAEAGNGEISGRVSPGRPSGTLGTLALCGWKPQPRICA